MLLSDFDFDLPEDRIALRPVSPRRAAKMLVAQAGKIEDSQMAYLPDFLCPGDRLVFNNTKVIPARLFGQRHRHSAQGPVSAKIEVTMLAAEPNGHWRCLVKPLRKLAIGEAVQFSPDFRAICRDKSEGEAILEFEAVSALDEALDAYGHMPLPPYIAGKRAADARDREDYQTFFAKVSGAVAAPTASLHFDETLLSDLSLAGVDVSEVTLHVGAGTFLPVKTDNVDDHKMHAEWGEVTQQAVDEIRATKLAGGRVIPVGTTALRLIETAAHGGKVEPWSGDTDIFIRPGFEFHAADGLITNFHLPKSTLMMLVSALMGKDAIDAIYAHAIANEYRFFSYGDGSLLIP